MTVILEYDYMQRCADIAGHERDGPLTDNVKCNVVKRIITVIED